MTSSPQEGQAARPNGAPVVLITGAGGTIGIALARALASRGARLALSDRAETPLRAIAEELSGTAIVADVTASGAAQRIVAETLGVFGRIDGLVNNVGVEGPIGPIEEISLDEVRRVFDINVLGMIALTQAAIPVMRTQQSGRILNIASGAGTAGSAWMAAYSASKHAVIGFTRSVAREVAAAGIAVNALCPGCVDSPMMQRIESRLAELHGQDRPVTFLPAIPLGRYVAPEEVASVAVWLLLDAPMSVIGVCDIVDGGMRA